MTHVYDAGALVALERGDREMWAVFKGATRRQEPPICHGGIVGQVWRDGARQARLARALKATEVAPLDEPLGRQAGALLAASGTTDVIDAALSLLASDGGVIYTSDPDDIAHLAATLELDVEVVRV